MGLYDQDASIRPRGVAEASLVLSPFSDAPLAGFRSADQLRQIAALMSDDPAEVTKLIHAIVPLAVTGGMDDKAVINPLHPDLARAVVSAAQPVAMDPRLFPAGAGGLRHKRALGMLRAWNQPIA